MDGKDLDRNFLRWPPLETDHPALESINETLSARTKFGLLLRNLNEPNATLRFGSSMINHNTTSGLDLIINDCFISFFPNTKAVYYLPRNPDDKEQGDHDGDCLDELVKTPDQTFNVARISKHTYTWLVNNEERFLEEIGSDTADRLQLIYSRKNSKSVVPTKKLKYLGTRLAKPNSMQNDFGGQDLLVNDLCISFFPGIKAVYFMAQTAWGDEGDLYWGDWWHFFDKTLNLGIVTMQYSPAGITWFIYDTSAYQKICNEYGFDPIQFKISPSMVDWEQS